MGLHGTAFFLCIESRQSLDNAVIMSLPLTLSVSGGEWRSGLAWTLGFCMITLALLAIERTREKTASWYDRVTESRVYI